MSRSLTQKEFGLICRLWRNFFPHDKEPTSQQDNRVKTALAFFEFFLDPNSGALFLNGVEWSNHGNIYFDCNQLEALMPFQDFITLLREKPNEVMAAFAFALALIADRRFPFGDPLVLNPRFLHLKPETPYSHLKSGIVGQLISLRGYVVRVGAPRPLIEGAQFVCGKCHNKTWVRFEDGIYDPPSVCKHPCRAQKSLVINRQKVQTSVFQRIKLQELEAERDGTVLGTAEDTAARIPKTFEVEARGILVNQCVPGDVIEVVGIVKAAQSEGYKGKDRESALHTLYVLGNSLRIIKGSTDTATRTDTSRTAATQGTAATAAATGSSNSSSSSSQGGLGPAEMALSDPNRSTALKPFTDQELADFQAIAMHEACLGLLVSSLCPTILGQELVKMGLLLGLMGGTQRGVAREKAGEAGLHVRSDVHVLIVGDPGLGKSQLLRAAAAVAPRAVMVCGNTATTAGLTVTVTREFSRGGTGEVCLEAGALVLADQGVCCIDELDKITCDHHALLEAMEQQSISVAKSGVVTSIRTRASVLAAANPAGGHYNRRKTVCENLKMPAALLSRFDLVFIIVDKRDSAHDRLITEHIIKTHALADGPGHLAASRQFASRFTENSSNGVAHAAPLPEEHGLTIAQRLRRHNQIIEQSSHRITGELFRRYIEYARKYVHPRLSKPAAKVLQRLYLTMRSQASLGKSIPVTTRNLESLIRLAQACARLELRDCVTEQDAQDVAELLQESLLDAFMLESGELDLFNKSGKMGGAQKQIKALVKAMQMEATARGSKLFTTKDIAEIARKLQLDKKPEDLIESMHTECYLLLKGNKTYELSC